MLLLASLLIARSTVAFAQTDATGATPPAVDKPTGKPADPPVGYSFTGNIPYSTPSGATLVADFYVPSGQGPFPAIVFVHGGGWRGGDRNQLRRQAAYMAQHGMLGMAIEYRLAPAHPHPAAIVDARAAVAYLRSHAAQYHVDPNKIAAAGSSAGGHLAALLGVESVPGGISASSVQAVVAFNGIYDLATMPPSTMVSDLTGGPCAQVMEVCRNASPIDQVRRGAPPFLLLHGTADKTAPYTQATSFLDKLKASGVDATLFTAEGAPHTFWAQAKWLQPTQVKMCLFLRAKLTPGKVYPDDCEPLASTARTAP